MVRSRHFRNLPTRSNGKSFKYKTGDTHYDSIVSSQNTTMIGIAFNLILIRTAQNKAGIEEAYSSGGTQGTAISFTSPAAISVQVQSRVDTDSAPAVYGQLE